VDARRREREQARREDDEPSEGEPVRLQRSTTSTPGMPAGSSWGRTSRAQSRVFQAGAGVEQASRGTNRDRWTSWYSWM
jgi:hypothetical protein